MNAASTSIRQGQRERPHVTAHSARGTARVESNCIVLRHRGGHRGTTAAALTGELGLGDEVAKVCVSAKDTVELDRVCFPRAGQVMFLAEHGVVGAAPRTTEQQSAVNVPTPLDVDRNGTPDVTATFRVVDPNTFSLQVDKVLALQTSSRSSS